MIMDAEFLLGIIRKKYLKYRNAIHIDTLFFELRGMGYKDYDIRNTLEFLKNKGDIQIVNFTIIPKEIPEKNEYGVKVTLNKIKATIRAYIERYEKYPTPSEIEKLFRELFGEPEIKDFTRYLRQLVEKGLLKRTHDFRYYYKGMENIKVKNLNYFTNL